jgi:hypothetical protein
MLERIVRSGATLARRAYISGSAVSYTGKKKPPKVSLRRFDLLGSLQVMERLSPFASRETRGRRWRRGGDLRGLLLGRTGVIAGALCAGGGVLRRRLSAIGGLRSAVRSGLCLIGGRRGGISPLVRSRSSCAGFSRCRIRLIGFHPSGVSGGLCLLNGFSRGATGQKSCSDHERQEPPLHKTMHMCAPL